jgi:Amt family ammonium transporter
VLKKLAVASGVGGAVVVAGATPAFAADEITAPVVQANLDNAFVLLAAVLVIFMQAGFALVEAGLTRAKSVGNIMMKNLTDFIVGVLAFFCVGFAFAFGIGNDFIGTSGFFLEKLGNFNAYVEPAGSLTLPVFFVFQVAFAATAATIVSGAMAERTKFIAYLLYSVIISALIYPIVVHWVWGGGWLSQLDTPFIDFAGSTLVHSVGGWAALMGAIFLGPRIGKYGADGKPRAIPGHSISFAVLGTFILWVGWYGFNPGSELAADSAIGPIALTTTLAGAAGAVMAMLTSWVRGGKPDVSMTANGALAGLVGITAGCFSVHSWAAIVIGGIAGILVVFAVSFFDRVKVDDPVGAISVHGVCGAWGTLAVGLFAAEGGLITDGQTDQLVTQAIGVLAVFAFVSVAAAILFATIKATVGLRVSSDEEEVGLDMHEHGMKGYADFVFAETDPEFTLQR